MTATGRWPRVRAALDRRATPRAITVAGYVIFLLYAYPGYLTLESADILGDARTGVFTDWYSPGMSELWRHVEWLVAGPFGMLVVQSALFLAGALHLLRRALSPRAAALAACGLLVFPPVLTPLAVIWRDGQMAGYLLAGAAAITSPRRGIRVLGLGLLVLGCAMRDSAAVAALPLVVVGFAWRDGQRWWLRGAIAGLVWLAVVLCAVGLNAALVDATTRRPQVALASADLVGMLRYSEPRGDAEIARELTGIALAPEGIQARARAIYGRLVDPTAGPDRVFDPPETAEQRAALIDARDGFARRHPLAYLATRWHAFYRLLGLSRATRQTPVYTSFVEHPDHQLGIGHAAQHSRVQRLLNWPVARLGPTLVFRPYLYLLVALALLPVAAFRRQRDAAMLLASGCAHELSLFALSATAEYRLSHWMVACTALAAVLVIARRRAARG